MRTFIIAEAGVNHNGSLARALDMVDCAAASGADCIKFQTFNADRLATRDSRKAAYQIKNTGTSESQWEMLKRLELSEEAHRELVERCKDREIEFLSSPFDEESVDFLVSLGGGAIKIPSGEITNGPLLVKIASTGKSVIMSTGMSTLADVELALGALAFGYCQSSAKDVGATPSIENFKRALSTSYDTVCKHVTLLHCTSLYPTPPETVNLKAMETLRASFGLRVGLSDHSEGHEIAVAAVALGATVIEKHFTLDRDLPGPDHKASLAPEQLLQLVTAIRKIELALGSGLKMPAPDELETASVARKSVVAKKAIKKGDLFLETNLTVKRPGLGLSPMYYWKLLGTVAARDYREDEAIEEDQLLNAMEKNPGRS